MLFRSHIFRLLLVVPELRLLLNALPPDHMLGALHEDVLLVAGRELPYDASVALPEDIRRLADHLWAVPLLEIWDGRGVLVAGVAVLLVDRVVPMLHPRRVRYPLPVYMRIRLPRPYPPPIPQLLLVVVVPMPLL